MSWVIITILIILGVGLIWLIYSLIWGTPPSINLAVERYALRMLLADPELLTQLGLLDNTLLDFHSGRLTNASPKGDELRRQLDRDGLALIRRFDPEKLHGQQRITYHLMRWFFDHNLNGHRFDYHWQSGPVFMGPYPVNHVCGVQVDLIQFLSTHHKIKGPRSLRCYLRRLSTVEWKLAGLTAAVKARAAAGVVPPKFVLEKSLAQIRTFLAEQPEDNPLYTHAIEKMEAAGRFNHREMACWGKRIQQAIEEQVKPAYQSLAVYLEGLLVNASDDDGVWKLPEGEAYYAYLLRHHTTTDLTAAQIHQIGLDEVQRLTAEVAEILNKLGLPADKPGQQLQALREAPHHHYQGENQRQAIISDYQTILEVVNQRMPEVFNFGSLDTYAVQRLPEFKEPDSPIAYAQPPSLDGSTPGTLWLNLRDPDNVYRWGMQTLAYHEGIPGHVYQLTQAQKLRGLPTFRKNYFFNAYVEGWALYAEQLAWELGLEDDLSNLGRLQALLWRAVRLVVDTGIHAQSWTRQEAIDYMIEKTGLPERDVVTEVERYIVMPGQACAYYIGYLEMLALRQKAQSTLGDDFDLKAFHDVIINQGGLPLSLLREAVNDFIDQTAGLISSS
ncbi:MAG: DUF885 domain-containing protein [Chloroflexi bacterium]|jgi:uncharacterized protein (DUF885 family)|nr:DUF885 domain-containing protein [Chloroflexota bacterium]